MDSALTPRDIQARIRAGETLDEVAAAAGVPSASIEAFAGPVLAEREHLAGMAQGAPVRRKGEPTSQGALGTVVAMALLRAGIDADTVTWDAWREPDRHWLVQASWTVEDTEQVAEFGFDPRSRYSVARNQLAATLIGERPAAERAPRTDPDSEPTLDLNDQLAIVRAIRSEQPDADAGDLQAVPSPEQSADLAEPTIYRTRVEVEQVTVEQDEVYDMVPGHSEMDVLYEMLSSFSEDSVNIYAGLSQTTVDEYLADPDAARESDGEVVSGSDDSPAADQAAQAERQAAELFAAQGIFDHDRPPGLDQAGMDQAGMDQAVPRQASPGADDASTEAESATPEPDPEAAEPTRRITRPRKPRATKAAAASTPEPVAPAAEPEQDALVEGPEPEAKPRPRKKGRASVPSWDEIMFGGPKQP